MIGKGLIYLHEFLELANSTHSSFSLALLLGLTLGQGPMKREQKLLKDLRSP